MLRLVALALLAACADVDKPAADDTDGSPAAGPDPTCPIDAALFETVAAEVTLAQTVVRVTWATSEPVAARVLYVDEADGVLLSTPVGPEEAAGEALVLGLRPGHSVAVQVEATVDGERRCSPAAGARTGTLPSDLPGTILTVNDVDRAVRGWQSVAVIREENRYAAILDADGQFVWASSVPGLFRANLSLDRAAMIALRPPAVWDGDADLVRIPLDGSAPTMVQVPAGHTDFVELPDGTIAVLGWTARRFEDGTRRLLGDTIIEVRPDGTQAVVWDLFEHVDPFLEVDYPPSPVDDGAAPTLEEWSHVNSIAYDAASDDYLVTGTFNHSVMRIDRGSGELLWTLSDDVGESDWDIDSEETEIELPHSVQLVDEDTVLVFNRGSLGSTDAPAACAWVSELRLDADSGAATPLWHYDSDDCVTVPFLGQARRIADGNTLINWSSAGRLSQVDADGAVVLQVDVGIGAAFGSGEWVESLY